MPNHFCTIVSWGPAGGVCVWERERRPLTVQNSTQHIICIFIITHICSFLFADTFCCLIISSFLKHQHLFLGKKKLWREAHQGNRSSKSKTVQPYVVTINSPGLVPDPVVGNTRCNNPKSAPVGRVVLGRPCQNNVHRFTIADYLP